MIFKNFIRFSIFFLASFMIASESYAGSGLPTKSSNDLVSALGYMSIGRDVSSFFGQPFFLDLTLAFRRNLLDTPKAYEIKNFYGGTTIALQFDNYEPDTLPYSEIMVPVTIIFSTNRFRDEMSGYISYTYLKKFGEEKKGSLPGVYRIESARSVTYQPALISLAKSFMPTLMGLLVDFFNKRELFFDEYQIQNVLPALLQDGLVKRGVDEEGRELIVYKRDAVRKRFLEGLHNIANILLCIYCSKI